MFLTRIFGRNDARSTRRPLPRRRPLVEALEGRQLLSTFTVSNLSDSGAGSLRQAILSADAQSSASTINFSIGTGGQTIIPLTALPTIKSQITIDGTTQPGYTGSPLIEIDGTKAGSSVEGLTISGSNNQIKGLTVIHFSGDGILIQGNDNTIAGDYVGLRATGSGAGNSGSGIIVQGSYNTIGGVTNSGRNVISSNGWRGVWVDGSTSKGNVIEGNRIGTNTAGTSAMGNGGDGVSIVNAPDNTVGGTVAGASNLISGNCRVGVWMDGSTATGNLVAGNLVGTNVTGKSALGNDLCGVQTQGASGNTIGGTTSAALNVISSNHTYGVWLGSDSAHNLVEGNLIGTNASGTGALGNCNSGVWISGGSDHNVIGGTIPGAGNVISGNGNRGVHIDDSTNNLVEGNLIGTKAAGTGVLGNADSGVLLSDSANNNIIGGTATGARNVISNNGYNGVHIDYSSANNVVQGNLIGTDVTGTIALGNADSGVQIENGSTGNVIGGTAPGAGNVISGNGADGVYMLGSDVTGNVVQGNKIGTDVTGTVALPNGYWGVGIQEAPGNTVGGPAATAGNVISGNSEGGVAILGVDATSDVVQGNLIGTDVTGTQALGNGYSGVYVGDWGVSGDAASGATIVGNVISANGNWGVWIDGAGANGNVVAGNMIGADITGTVALGNAYDGIMIDGGAASNVIGGTTAGTANTIAYNQGNGVALNGAGTGNAIEGNLINANGFGAAAGQGNGVSLTSSPGTTVVSNTITANRDWGISSQDSDPSSLTGNTSRNNGLGDVYDV